MLVVTYVLPRLLTQSQRLLNLSLHFCVCLLLTPHLLLLLLASCTGGSALVLRFSAVRPCRRSTALIILLRLRFCRKLRQYFIDALLFVAMEEDQVVASTLLGDVGDGYNILHLFLEVGVALRIILNLNARIINHFLF